MTKTQKIWLWVSLGMFFIPEILFGALLRIFKNSTIPIFQNIQSDILGVFIIIVELFGLYLTLRLIKLSNLKKHYKVIILTIISVMIGVLLLALLLTFVYLNMGI